MAATLQQQPINLNQQNGGGGVVHQILQGTSPAPPQQQQQQQILFTVEQIELVRRLRNSGITKEQLVLAFDSLDRLDRELGPVYSIPISQAFTQQLFARQVLAAASAVPIIHPQPPPPVTSPPQCTPPPPPPPPHQLPPLAPLQHPQPQRSPQLNGTCSPRRVPTPNKNAVVVGGLSAHIEQKENYINFKAEPMNLSGEEPMITTSTPPPPNGEALNFSVSLGDLVLNPVEDIKDDNTEFICFAAQGEPACCDQIRAYVAKYNIRQQQIATLSRISQSYVSRFLKGDFFDMSERSRRAIKKWYIAYRNNPAAIAVAVNLVLLSHGAQNGNSPPSSTCAGSATSSSTPKLSISDLTAAASAVPPQPNPEFLNQRRRERFVFRPNHLEILEKHFQEDSYPSFEKREEMARLCNAATESLTGRPLGDKEVVTAQIVSNWFANKRKEMKKLAREEGLDLSQVPLRNRGRPCRFFGDLMAQIQEGQNSRDSGAIDMETAINGHLHEAQMLMNNESNAAATAVATNYRRKEQQDSNSGAVGDASNGGGGSGSEDIVTVIPRAPEETAAEEEAAAAAAMSGNSSHDERTLSLSVELAAVNQAILSLTGQQPLSAAAAITTSAASSHAPHTPVMCIPSTAAATATTIQQLTTTTTTTTTTATTT